MMRIKPFQHRFTIYPVPTTWTWYLRRIFYVAEVVSEEYGASVTAGAEHAGVFLCSGYVVAAVVHVYISHVSS